MDVTPLAADLVVESAVTLVVSHYCLEDMIADGMADGVADMWISEFEKRHPGLREGCAIGAAEMQQEIGVGERGPYKIKDGCIAAVTPSEVVVPKKRWLRIVARRQENA